MSSPHDPPARQFHRVWIKSSHSGPTGGNCVEMAHLYGGQVAVRNSRHPEGPALLFTAEEWAAFLAGAKDGEFDRPELPARPGAHPGWIPPVPVSRPGWPPGWPRR